MTAVAEQSALLGVYRFPDTPLSRGEGCVVEDANGRRYLDFIAGIGVNALGYDSPIVRNAILEAVDTGLIHTSNLFRNRAGEELARFLVERSFPGKVFFTNSGGEAGEAALKFARRWARAAVGETTKTEIVSFEGAFHGRLFGTLSATWRAEYRAPFEPLLPGVHFAPLERIEEVAARIDRERTAAVIVEPVQGEGGIRAVSHGFLQELRALTREREVALIFDEIQCGVGRTGSFLAHTAAGITPDLLLLAKPLAGGLPMGAVIAAPHIAETLRPGDHGSTFGGGPLVSAVALAVVQEIAQDSFLAEVRRKGDLLEKALLDLAGRRPERVLEVRGVGLMRGIRISGSAGEVVSAAREAGLLLAPAGLDVVRLLPPLIVSDEEIAEAVEILDAVLAG